MSNTRFMKTLPFHFKLLLVCILLFATGPLQVSGQHRQNSVPLSFGRALSSENVSIAEIGAPPADAVSAASKSGSLPYTFTINIPVSFSFLSSGSTEILSDGQRVWRFSVRSAGAKALILYFDRFSIPDGGKFFVYNPSRTEMYGAYTSANRNSFGTFACPMVEGESVVLEYNAPGETPLPDIRISELGYAFRGFLSTEANSSVSSSGKCEVNVNCSEGANWQTQKRGVVKIVVKDSVGSSHLCSGSMINNTSNDGTPYLLTADHCGRISRPVDLSQWLFYFNYEMPGCANTTADPATTLLGAVMKAHAGTELTSSDFYLVRLTETIPESLHVYFNGWNREEVASPSGTGIHHPAGDVKKISTYKTPLISANYPGNPKYCHWMVVWNYTENGHGVTEGGSSGSPIFNPQGQIVGTLTGGDSGCDTTWINSPDYYGKFSWHWDKNGTDSTSVLKYWLDPHSTGVTSMGGWAVGISENKGNEQFSMYPNPANGNATLTVTRELPLKQGVSVSIMDLLGKPYPGSLISQLAPGRYGLDLSSLSPGIYFVIVSGPDFRQCMKLVKL